MRLFLLLSAVAALAAAHSKITIVTGNLGGNGSALGVLGGIVPSNGSNKVTQRDTTVFPRPLKLKVDGLGKVDVMKADVTVVEGGTKLKPSDLEDTLKLSGDLLPQVSSDGSGALLGRYHIVAGDGAGPLYAVIDTTASGKFEDGIEANVTLNVPGNKGRIRAGGIVPYSFPKRSMYLSKRAPVVNLNYRFTIAVPKGLECKGKVAGNRGVCFMKISNLNHNGPFGGTIAFQVGQNGTSTVAGAPLVATETPEM